MYTIIIKFFTDAGLWGAKKRKLPLWARREYYTVFVSNQQPGINLILVTN